MIRTMFFSAGVTALASLASSQQNCDWDLPADVSGNDYASSMSILEHDVLVGYPFAMNDSGWSSGRIKILNRGFGGELSHLGWLDSPSPGNASQGFGSAIARDGDRIAVTCPGELQPGGTTLGAVFTFRQNGPQGWDLEDTILAPTILGPGSYGIAVELAGDWLFVSDPNVPAAGPSEGVVYIYRNSPAGWSLTQTLVPSHPVTASRFGYGASMAYDSGRLVVGCHYKNPFNANSGVYVYEEAGGMWFETTRIDGIPGGGTSQSFGLDVAISGDLMVVGAPTHQPVPGSLAWGAAAVYKHDPQLGWTPAAVLKTESYGVLENYGTHVGVDRGRVLVAGWEADMGLGIEVWGEACDGWHQSHQFGLPSSGGSTATTTAYAGISGDVVISSHGALLAARHLTCTLGRSYCDPNTQNATGLAGRLRAAGSTAVADNALTLVSSQLPPMSAGLMFFSQTPIVSPLQSCTAKLCLGGTIARGSPQALVADASGEVDYVFDTSSLPPVLGGGPVMPGETWYFQYFHRNPDPALPIGITNAVLVTFD